MMGYMFPEDYSPSDRIAPKPVKLVQRKILRKINQTLSHLCNKYAKKIIKGQPVKN